MTKVTIHWQMPSIPSWGQAYMDRSKAEYVKVMDPGTQDPFPNHKTIVRTYNRDDSYFVGLGAAGADIWMDIWESYYLERPWAWAFEGPNEPSIWVPEVLSGFAGFHQRFIQRMHDIGRRVVVGNINVGWPNYDQIDEIGAGIQGADAFSVHEYGGPGGMWDPDWTTWLCLRYRRTAQWLGELGYQVPPIIITETGIDFVRDNIHYAWKDLFNYYSDPVGAIEKYIEQLVWYEQELRKDDFVLAATIFTGSPNQDWMKFEVTEELAMKLAESLAELPDHPPLTERAKGFMATKYQTTLNWDLIGKEYDYVMLRISGPNFYPGYTCTEVDPWLDEHIAGAEHVGLLKGGFHYLVADMDGQARVFADGASHARWELPLFTDVEEGALTRERVDLFNHWAEIRLSENGVVYPSLGIYTNLWLNDKLGPWGRTLWLAQWGVAEPSISGWTFWQYAGGPIPDGETTSLDVYVGTPKQLLSEYGNSDDGDKEETYMECKVFDASGTERDWSWAVERYGVELLRATPPVGETVFRLTEVRQKIGPCSLTVKVVDESGMPVSGVAMMQGWVDDPQELAPQDAPRFSLTNWNQPNDKPNRGSGGFTNDDGIFGWGWGSGEQYDPSTQEGAHWYWTLPGGNEVYTDCILGLGWLVGTDHDTLTLTFTETTASEDNPEPETDILEALNRLISIVERLATHLGA